MIEPNDPELLRQRALLSDQFDQQQNGGAQPLFPEADPAQQQTIVDFTRPPVTRQLGAAGPMLTSQGDFTTVDFEPGQPFRGALSSGVFQNAMNFDANLAEFMDEAALSLIADKIIEWVDTDKEARKPNEDFLRRGLELLGLTDAPDDALLFPGACSVTYPLIGEAMVQFAARALPELFPPEGPAKATVVGEKTQDLEDQAERVSDHMNYQLTVEDLVYRPESDQMLHVLPLKGSLFRKTYPDPANGRVITRLVNDLIVPYTATSLHQAPRYTYAFPMERNELRKAQANGYYRDAPLQPPSMELWNHAGADGDLWQAMEDAEGKTHSIHEDDARHELLECHCDWDLPGFEDTDETGGGTGIALPYVITVERESRRVLAIYRNWRQADPHRMKRVWFTHYKFLPGLGFYGFGYIHFIGSLAEAATDTLRALLDAAAFATLQGGFKAKDSKLPGGTMRQRPGEWIDVDMTSEELQKAFYSPDFKEPSEAIFKLLGLLAETAQRFTSTTEAMVGDASNTGPVGTTVALIEQGTKVYSGIHLRLHGALGEELQLRAELNGEHIEAYPFKVRGKPQQIAPWDYDDRVDVIPVSDPNIWSSVQRIAQAQVAVDLIEKLPDVGWDKREVAMRVLVATKTPDPDKLLPQPADTPPLDPVGEVMAIMQGRPVKAFPDQDHAAHLQVLTAWLQHPGFGANPLMAEKAPAAVALIGDHAAQLFQVRMAQLGVPMAPAGPDGQPQPLPPPVAQQGAVMAAQASIHLAGLSGIPALQQPGAGGPDDPNAQPPPGQLEAAAQATAAAHAQGMRDATAAGADHARQQQAHAAEQKRLQDAHDAAMQRGKAEGEHKQRMADAQYQKLQDEMARAAKAEQQEASDLGEIKKQLSALTAAMEKLAGAKPTT
jgi:chaperonin GroES